MFDKWRKYSYVAQKERRLHFLKVSFWLLVSFAAFTLIGTLFISTVVVENTTMEPGIKAGDRFMVSPFPFGIRIPALGLRLPGPQTPTRGDLVIVERAPRSISNIRRFVDSFVRFFSAQRVRGPSTSSFALKRVVGIPGDTVSMRDHVMRVKPAGDAYGLTEFELTKRPYDIVVPELPSGWNDGLPFSGALDWVVLERGEYFVLSDDRSGADDSRVWGTVPLEAIVGKVLFRYWPLSRFGRP